jgi:CDP-paratose synthetase
MNGKRNLLITGATGFIGEPLVKELVTCSENKIAIVVRDLEKSYRMFGDNIVYIEYEKENFKQNIINFNPEMVIHLAAYSTANDDLKNIKKLIDTNILFLSILLNALSKTKIKLFLNTGSFAEYYYNDNVLSPAYFYSATKTAGRSILHYYHNLHGMKFCTVVPYTVYGIGNRKKKIIDIIFDSLDNDKTVKMTEGKQLSDFIYISDIIDFYMLIINNPHLVKNAEDYHVGTGKAYSLRDIASIVEKISNKTTNITWGGLEYRPLDMMRAIAPIYKLEKELNWKSMIDIERGIELMWKERKNKC